MGKYHYEYYLVCVDLCNGGAKRGPYRSIQNARFDIISYMVYGM